MSVTDISHHFSNKSKRKQAAYTVRTAWHLVQWTFGKWDSHIWLVIIPYPSSLLQTSRSVVLFLKMKSWSVRLEANLAV